MFENNFHLGQILDRSNIIEFFLISLIMGMVLLFQVTVFFFSKAPTLRYKKISK